MNIIVLMYMSDCGYSLLETKEVLAGWQPGLDWGDGNLVTAVGNKIQDAALSLPYVSQSS